MSDGAWILFQMELGTLLHVGQDDESVVEALQAGAIEVMKRTGKGPRLAEVTARDYCAVVKECVGRGSFRDTDLRVLGPGGYYPVRIAAEAT